MKYSTLYINTSIFLSFACMHPMWKPMPLLTKKDVLLLGTGLIGGACALLAGQYIWKSLRSCFAKKSVS